MVSTEAKNKMQKNNNRKFLKNPNLLDENDLMAISKIETYAFTHLVSWMTIDANYA